MNIETYFESGYYIAILDEPDWNPNLNLWGTGWYPEINTWCEQTYGRSDLWGEEPVNGWKCMRNKYFFTDEQQFMMFALRWS
jgi:hypothetical protein